MKITSKLSYALILAFGKSVVRILPGENTVDSRFSGVLMSDRVIQLAMKDKMLSFEKDSPLKLAGKVKASPVQSKVEVKAK